MHTKTISGRFIVLASEFEKELATRDAARELIGKAECAYSLRQLEIVHRIGQRLEELEFQIEGEYYCALAANSRGSGNLSYSNKAFERISNTDNLEYRAKATTALAFNARLQGDFDSAIRLHHEAFRMLHYKPSPLALVQNQKNLAVVLSMQGCHAESFRLLESVSPIVSTLGLRIPVLVPDHLNSLAVELSEIGRVEEANQANSITLASPYLPYYDEWLDTKRDLQSKKAQRESEAVILVGLPVEESNVLQGPFPATAQVLNHAPKNKDVIDLTSWKAEMPGKQEKDKTENQTAREFRRLSHDEKEHRLLREIVTSELLDEDLDHLMIELIRLRNKQQKKEGN